MNGVGADVISQRPLWYSAAVVGTQPVIRIREETLGSHGARARGTFDTAEQWLFEKGRGNEKPKNYQQYRRGTDGFWCGSGSWTAKRIKARHHTRGLLLIQIPERSAYFTRR